LGGLLTACGEQKPAFTERVEAPAASGDATAENGKYTDLPPAPPADSDGSTRSTGSTGSITPGADGSGTIDPNLLPAVSDAAILRANSKVDVLWIVDSSGSMREEQTYLGQNFSSFISQLSRSNGDFQVGVTSTDVCDPGAPSLVPLATRYCPTLDGTASSHLRGYLVGANGSRVLKPLTPDLTTKFVTYANVGVSGSSFEHGLTAAKMAIQKSLAGQNEGFVRPDAHLAVIVVSDEEDDGIGLGMDDVYTGMNYIAAGSTSYRYTADDFIRDATAMKGAGKFSVSAITGTRQADGSICTSAHSQPREEGTQYISAARKTGGIVQSICDTNWSASLSTIGQDIAAQSSQVALSRQPYEPTIRVFVNGAESTHWTYSRGNNSVKFNVGFLPAAGSQIRVDYRAVQ